MTSWYENEWFGDTLTSVDELRAENKQLRILLALSYSGAGLYTDDGEFSCGKDHPAIDFKRMPVTTIEHCMRQRAKNAFALLSKEDVDQLFRPLAK